jgi:beta-glucosidase/6-phospho-beta-glucosidase/beta-galactosidase
MYVCAKFSALFGWWNEQMRDERAYVTALKHLARANILAMHEIARVRPDAVFVQSESSEYFHASSPDAVQEAERRNQLRFLSLDLNYGRPLAPVQRDYVLAHGMTPDECRFFEAHAPCGRCVLGSDYYVTNEHHVHPDGRSHGAGETIGYAMIAREYAERYRLPMMHTETNRDQDAHGDEACNWLYRQFAVVRSLMRSGVQVVGFTWYSLTDQIDWHIELRDACGVVNPRGLYDLERHIRPVGIAYRDLIAAWDGRISSMP